jgi:hypothetical protein
VTGSPGAIVVTSGAVRDLNHHLGDGAAVFSGGSRVTLELDAVRAPMARCRAMTSNRAVACLLLAIHDLIYEGCRRCPIGSAGRARVARVQ